MLSKCTYLLSLLLFLCADDDCERDLLPDESATSKGPSAGGDCERDLVPDKSPTSEAQNDMSQPLLSPNHNKKKLSPIKRKQQDSNELSKRRSIKGSCTSTFHVGEPSEVSQTPKPKGKGVPVEELLKKHSALKVLKILGDRVNRQIKIDERADLYSCVSLMKYVMENEVVDLYQPIFDSLNRIKKIWPPRTDLENIKKKIKEEEDKERKKKNGARRAGAATMEVTDEMKQTLKEIEKMIERSIEKRREDTTKVENLEKILTTEGVSVDTLREELSSAFPWLFWEKTAANEPTVDQGSWRTREKKLFAKDKNKVDVSNFQGLEDEITTAELNDLPRYLKLVARKLEDHRGEATDFADANILALLFDNLKEMESLRPEQLSLSTLFKWGATVNKAKELLHYPVDFVEIHLKRSLLAYFGLLISKASKKGPEIRG
ncbi:uncharacterized protein LOC111311722 [Durio zibethinus]|uniref:Uncharacterized protein LOC111311722 n=1 Tax=Durio zibethinus TaxID=66656 RepID=A0A6P6AQI5_DURZI|nr:uncharacterized protein LOC111311722 [Durio zibethinus]XP_022767095.1 uncharacterized protein LOC111311722 [Durio zibethinus]